MGQSAGHSVPDQRARVRDSPGKTPLCTLMAPDACKIHLKCYVLQVPIQIIPGVTKVGQPSSPWQIKKCHGMSPDHPLE